jgi:hypothetical protein
MGSDIHHSSSFILKVTGRWSSVEKRVVMGVAVGALSDASGAGSFGDQNGPNSSKNENIGRIGIDTDCQIW